MTLAELLASLAAAGFSALVSRTGRIVVRHESARIGPVTLSRDMTGLSALALVRRALADALDAAGGRCQSAASDSERADAAADIDKLSAMLGRFPDLTRADPGPLAVIFTARGRRPPPMFRPPATIH